MRKSQHAGSLVAIIFAIGSHTAVAQHVNNQHTAKPAPKAAPAQRNAVRRGPAPGFKQGMVNRGQPQRAGLAGAPNRNLHASHAAGGRAYHFGGHGVRRDMHALNHEERLAWQRGRWHHERRFGRDGYWWEVNGSWYWYASPMSGPPAYVSEAEFFDPAPAAAVVYGAPAAVAPAPSPEAVLGGVIGGAIGGILSGR